MFVIVWFLAIGALVGSWFLLDYVTELRARRYLLAAVANSSGVRLNGEPVADPSVVLTALGGLAHVPAHHSGPTAAIRVTLMRGADSVPVVIARDSKRPEEFWVYRPGSNWNNDPLGQAAGRVISTSLANLLSQRNL